MDKRHTAHTWRATAIVLAGILLALGVWLPLYWQAYCSHLARDCHCIDRHTAHTWHVTAIVLIGILLTLGTWLPLYWQAYCSHLAHDCHCIDRHIAYTWHVTDALTGIPLILGTWLTFIFWTVRIVSLLLPQRFRYRPCIVPSSFRWRSCQWYFCETRHPPLRPDQVTDAGFSLVYPWLVVPLENVRKSHICVCCYLCNAIACPLLFSYSNFSLGYFLVLPLWQISKFWLPKG